MCNRNSVVCLILVAGSLLVMDAKAETAEQSWQILLDGIFRDGTKPLYLYARWRDNQWISAVGSSRDPDRQGGKTYNKSWYYADLSRVPIKDGKMKGPFTLHMTPDFWVPRDHRCYTIEFEVDAKLTSADKLQGNYKITAINTSDESAKGLGRSGYLTGTAQPATRQELPPQVTFECKMQGSLVGADPLYGGRCMMLWLGLDEGKLVSAIHGRLSRKSETYDRHNIPLEQNSFTADKDRISGTITVPTVTLDMEPCRYIFDIDGRILDEHLVGAYKLTVKIDGEQDVKIDGSFDGEWYKGVTHLKTDDRPWYTNVKGFQPPKPTEHPRLLFRRSDLPELRKKANTPEGKAIIARLRYLLDGANGDTMTTLFSDATHAYMGGGYKNTVLDKPGAYTFGHVAGYGLLYQLTGDKKYARFGRQCFEKALQGQRDRDDRYSFKKPGGALRAGPILGWYAVGYDLCYDGWDKATREKFGRAIVDYSEGTADKKIDLEALTRGTMPPSSNHFGMQIGGASMALLAVTGEPWADQNRIDTLLRIAAQGMIRNVSEGFGDGGFFAEGDGTGSMASQIAYLSAVSSWKNVTGKDFVSVERPNVRMLTLKWIYQTVIKDGRPHFWPIRGSYGHNVWARHGLSGAGYFAYGMGAITDPQKAALKWYYNNFLLDADTKASSPYDTASPYPNTAVSAFINWPLDIEQANPAKVLPLCYRDSSCGFYAWRNRWRDENDTVITVLTSRTEGYMGAKPDKALMINSMGKHTRWATVKEGPTLHWSPSPSGKTSSLTLGDGTCYAVDFTNSSGADVMLITTGKAQGQSVKLADKNLTFYFPTTQTPPSIITKGDTAIIGKQEITIKDGNIELAIKD